MVKVKMAKWRMAKVKRLMATLTLNGPADAKRIKQIARELTNRYYNEGFNDGAEWMKRRLDGTQGR